MEVFEEQYKDDMDLDEAIMLGMEALYNASDMKLDASTLEVGVVKVEDKMFTKYSSQQVESYVERVLENHKDEAEDTEDEEAEQ